MASRINNINIVSNTFYFIIIKRVEFHIAKKIYIYNKIYRISYFKY